MKPKSINTSYLHILYYQQVSDQLNISSACTVYISLHG